MDNPPEKSESQEKLSRRQALTNILDHGRVLGTVLSVGGGGYFTGAAFGQRHESKNLGVPDVELVDPRVGPAMLAVGAAGVIGDRYYHRRDTLKLLGISTVAVVGAGAHGYDIARDAVRDLANKEHKQDGTAPKIEPSISTRQQTGGNTRKPWADRSRERSITDSRERD